MKTKIWGAILGGAGFMAAAAATPASAALFSVSGEGTVITAPSAVLEDDVTTPSNSQYGFMESSGVWLSRDIDVDGGTIAKGTRVDSYMIFYNTAGGSNTMTVTNWLFQESILGIMSDQPGNLEADSTDLLGNPGTTYDNGNAGDSAPYNARGLEAMDVKNKANDYYIVSGVDSTMLELGMRVTEPGDWIRVVTVSAVPLPAAAWFLLTALGGLVGTRWLKKDKAAAAAA
ncbi:VPLPA-CTERM sorting domain-containing protein [Roseospira navarrensis]|nr:VPLPA-CTERM sorting domain-containing protein [Roseospira navarrensis]